MNDTANPVTRVRLWYALLVVLFGMFAIRLFYLQIIKYDYYVKAARSDQIREYDVPAERGVITASLNGQPVPLVLNEKMFTVFADPGVIQKEDEVAGAIAPVLGMSKSKVADLLRTKDTRYVVLKKRVSPAVNKKLLSLKYAGINSQERHYRTYPQGTMAAQLLGFVNDEGQGKYGIEQALDSSLCNHDARIVCGNLPAHAVARALLPCLQRRSKGGQHRRLAAPRRRHGRRHRGPGSHAAGLAHPGVSPGL